MRGGLEFIKRARGVGEGGIIVVSALKKERHPKHAHPKTTTRKSSNIIRS